MVSERQLHRQVGMRAAYAAGVGLAEVIFCPERFALRVALVDGEAEPCKAEAFAAGADVCDNGGADAFFLHGCGRHEKADIGGLRVRAGEDEIQHGDELPALKGLDVEKLSIEDIIRQALRAAARQ